MSYLRPIEELLNSDAIKYRSPGGISELYGAVGDAQAILQLVGHQFRQIAKGLGELPTESDGLRTDTMDGVLDPNETAATAIEELHRAVELIERAAGHTQTALNKTARLYVEEN